MPNPTATIFLPYHALDNVILRGTRASQPPAANVTPGTLYNVTDENKVERSNGTIWESYSSSTALPGNLAYVDVANVFTQNQTVTKTRPELAALFTGRAARTRLAQAVADVGYFSNNLSHDGTNWNLDDTGNAGAMLYFDTGGNVIFYRAAPGTNPRPVVSTLVFSGGGGIGFPAVQLAQNDPNTLDDYEEGSWTPTLTFGGSAAGLTYNTVGGRYVKIGRFVFVSGRIGLTNKGSASGTALIGNLPFTISASSVYGSGGSVPKFLNMAGINNWFTVLAQDGTTNLELWNGGAISSGSITNANFGNTTDFQFECSYVAST